VVAALVLVLVLVGAASGASKLHTRACTHGVSSIGPVEIVNNKFVGGLAIPHTEVCIR
jgi:hypothetical protein